MNKFTRICIITALILIILGAGITIAGAAMGGFSFIRQTFEEYIPSFLDSRLEGKVYVGISSDHRLLSGSYSNKELATSEEIKKLDAEIGGGELNIKQSDTQFYKLEGNTKHKFQCYVENGELCIKGFKGNTTPRTHDNVLTLYIPYGATLEEIDIELGVGDVNADRLCASSISVDVGVGDMKVDALEANKVDVNVGVGEVNINGSTLDADVTIDVGGFGWTGIIANNMNLSCDIGSADLFLKQTTEDEYNYNVTCHMGDVTIGNRRYSNDTNGIEINNRSSYTYKIDCDMGSIKINFENN